MEGLKQYIGTKIIMAKPMTEGEFRLERGFTDVSEESLKSETYRAGYKVVYPDGYKSWSPKEAFEEAYRPTYGMNYGMAHEAALKGKCIYRDGWNGKNMHVEAVDLLIVDACRDIKIVNKGLVLFNVNGEYNTWIPSITDLNATDWNIKE